MVCLQRRDVVMLKLHWVNTTARPTTTHIKTSTHRNMLQAHHYLTNGRAYKCARDRVNSVHAHGFVCFPFLGDEQRQSATVADTAERRRRAKGGCHQSHFQGRATVMQNIHRLLKYSSAHWNETSPLAISSAEMTFDRTVSHCNCCA